MEPMMFAALGTDRKPAARTTLERELAAALAAVPAQRDRKPRFMKVFGL